MMADLISIFGGTTPQYPGEAATTAQQQAVQETCEQKLNQTCTVHFQKSLNVVNNTLQKEACIGLKGTEVPLRQSTPEVLKATLPTLNQAEIASVTSVSVTPINTRESETFPIITEIESGTRDCTDHSPLIMDKPILHLGYRS